MADPEFIAIRDLEITQLNGWRGGPFQQAISGMIILSNFSYKKLTRQGVTMLNNDWYDGKQVRSL
jgi:hypothetical protein